MTWEHDKLSRYNLHIRLLGISKWRSIGVYDSKSCILDHFNAHWKYEICVSEYNNDSNQAVASFITLHG